MLIVVKGGGNVIRGDSAENVFQDVAEMVDSHKLVFVHGGGGEVTDIANKLGKPQSFVVSPKGFRSRYTDRETAEIFTMVMVGKINSEIVVNLGERGVPSVGLSGLDGGLLKAQRKKRIIILDDRGRRRVIDGGYTGRITDVKADILQLFIENGLLPVVSPVALSSDFEALNVDGDRCAAHVAGHLRADRLILLTDVEGLILKGKVVSRLTSREARDLLRKIGPGMITKVYASLEALDLGVREVVISSGLIERPVSSALEHEVGTVIRSE